MIRLGPLGPSSTTIIITGYLPQDIYHELTSMIYFTMINLHQWNRANLWYICDIYMQPSSCGNIMVNTMMEYTTVNFCGKYIWWCHFDFNQLDHLYEQCADEYLSQWYMPQVELDSRGNYHPDNYHLVPLWYLPLWKAI